MIIHLSSPPCAIPAMLKLCLLWLMLIASNAVAANPDTAQDKDKARVLYSQGAAALKDNRIEEAITQLKAALVLDPENSDIRYTLALAYNKAGKFLNQWFQLRQALLLNKDFPDAERDFLTMWQIAGAKGILDVGTPQETVISALGEPDAKAENKRTHTWQYAFMVIRFSDAKIVSTTDLRGLQRLPAVTEILEIDFDDRDWKLKQRHFAATQSTLEYVPETAENASETVSIQRLFGLKNRMTTRQLMKHMHQNLQQRFPDVVWTVLRDEENDSLAEWRLSDDQTTVQHEIVRLLAGDSAIHRISYTAKSIKARDEWITRIADAELKAVSKPATSSTTQ